MPLTQKEMSDVNDIGVVRQEVLENMRENVSTWIALVRYKRDHDIEYTPGSVIDNAITFFAQEIAANLETIEGFRRITMNIAGKAKDRDTAHR